LTAAIPHLRIARPTLDLERAERFWTQGVGMSTLYRSRQANPENLTMVGFTNATWHIELTHHPANPVTPQSTAEDVVVLYLDGDIPDALVDRICEHGGRVVSHPNPYWNEWGVTIVDSDGYHLVLCTRAWTNIPLDRPETRPS